MMHVLRQDLHALLLIIVAGLLLWTLAYQFPLKLHLTIGGDVETHRREDDTPFLHGFNRPQPADPQVAEWWMLAVDGYSYRWAESDARITLPGSGSGRWIVTLVAASGRPDGTPVTTTWQLQHDTLSFPLDGLPRAYHVLTEADAAGDLHIEMETPAYVSPTDPRILGFVLYDVHLAPVNALPRIPALAHLGWLAITLALIYTLSRWLVLGVCPALLLALACAMLAAWLLAAQRFALTLMTPTLTVLLLVCWVVALVVRGVWSTRRAAIRTRPTEHKYGAVIALLVLAFALRMGGMLHPHAIFSDHRLHANNLLQFGLGDVYFTEGLPSEAGGGRAPYPPALYLVLAPLQLVAPADIESRAVLVQFGVALLDSLVVVLIWWLLWQGGVGQRAALIGAALYLLPLPVMVSFGIGEYANLGGQALALPAVAFLATSAAHAQPAGRGTNTQVIAPAWAWCWLVLLGVGWLSHLGVAISLTMVVVSAFALQVLRRLFGRASLSTWGLWSGVVIVACGVALCYYSAPEFTDIYARRLTGDASAAVPDPHTTEGAFISFARLAQVIRDLFHPGSRLPLLLIAGGLIGMALVWMQCRRGNQLYRTRHQQLIAPTCRLTFLFEVWWLGTVCSLGLFLIASQGVRWQLFLYPVLCLGAGPAFAAIGRHGRGGSLVAMAGIALLILQGLNVWVVQIYDYLH